jgi:very-short-patch-repair endonuclease
MDEVPSSRMEWEVYLELKRMGLRAEFQRSFCVMSTTPDIYFPEQRLAIYIDGVQVHVKRQEKDETLRELLAKRHGLKVISIPYERYSQKEKERILEEILKFI